MNFTEFPRFFAIVNTVKAVSDKYCDHLPLSRQVRIAARYGLDVTSQTLWDLSNAIRR